MRAVGYKLVGRVCFLRDQADACNRSPVLLFSVFACSAITVCCTVFDFMSGKEDRCGRWG